MVLQNLEAMKIEFYHNNSTATEQRQSQIVKSALVLFIRQFSRISENSTWTQKNTFYCGFFNVNYSSPTLVIIRQYIMQLYTTQSK